MIIGVPRLLAMLAEQVTAAKRELRKSREVRGRGLNEAMLILDLSDGRAQRAKSRPLVAASLGSTLAAVLGSSNEAKWPAGTSFSHCEFKNLNSTCAR